MDTGNDSDGAFAYDVAVVGGGIIGLSCAFELVSLGASVALLERSVPGGQTSWVAAGMLAPVAEAAYGEERLLEQTLAAAELYPNFVARVEAASNIRVGHMQCGALHIALDRDEGAELRRREDFLRSLGFEPEWLGPTACREREPGLTSRLGGGMVIPAESVVDPRYLCDALTASLVRGIPDSGDGFCDVFSGVEADEAVMRGDRVVGVMARAAGPDVRSPADGAFITADHVIAAGGALPGAYDWLPEEARPKVRPVKGQIVELGPPRDAAFDDTVIEGIVASERVYIVPRVDGRVIIGATVEERGYDLSVTAGGVHELLREAYRAVPDIAEMELIAAHAGLRPGTADNVPIVGPGELEGLVIATGHYRSGILLAPLTARTVAELVQEGVRR